MAEVVSKKLSNIPAVVVEDAQKQYLEGRLESFQSLHKAGISVYPHKFNVGISLSDFVSKYGHLSASETAPEEVSVAGRLYSKRASGSSLVFYDLKADGVKVQILSNAKHYAKGAEMHSLIHSVLRRGDIVGVNGHPGRSKTGELSVFVKEISLLSPCMQSLPLEHDGLKDQEVRYRQRYLDLIVNYNQVSKTFEVRSKVVKGIRAFLDNLGFLEVETPMMNMIPGGASARPFVTHHNSLGQDLYMRISPELYLKQLVVGGLNKVYELGKSFRNEGIDLTHNPEFTTCEAYAAFWDYEDMMKLTENLVSGLVKDITGGYVIQYHPLGKGEPTGKPVLIDFTPPYRRISMMSGIEEATGSKIPEGMDLSSDAANLFFSSLAEKHNVPCTAPRTTARLIDKLTEHFLESQCLNPTFIIDQPEVMSPLAKPHRHHAGLTERFELFAFHRELCNSYTELNDPRLQRERFNAQAKAKAAGDSEAQMFDEPFCVALEYGLPPTAGWAIGVDRMTMFLADHCNIKEVLLFPAMRPAEGLVTTDTPLPTTSTSTPTVSTSSTSASRHVDPPSATALCVPTNSQQPTDQGLPVSETPPHTELLYLRDTFSFSTNARVVSVEIDTSKDNQQDGTIHASVVFDRTVFYPQGGGQPSDVGLITGAGLITGGASARTRTTTFVVDFVTKKGDVVIHKGRFNTCTQEDVFVVGEEVNMEVNGERRLQHARLHSAGHLLDEAVAVSGLTWKPTKAYHFPEGAYVEYDGELPASQSERDALKVSIQDNVGQLLAKYADVNVEVMLVPHCDIEKLCGEPPAPHLPVDSNIRVVQIGVTKGACVGTHVHKLSQIPAIVVGKPVKKAGRIRLPYSVTV